MKIFKGNTLYDFTVAQTDTTAAISTSVDEFLVEFRYRRFQSQPQSQSPDFEGERSVRFPRNQSSGELVFMANWLEEFDVSEVTIANDMAAHFSFFVERLSRRSGNRRGSIHVAVSLNVIEYSTERAVAIQRRIETGRRERERERESRRVAVEVEAEAVAPVKRSVVERLVRERVVEVVEGESECSICLEKFGEGGEGLVLPCSHVYHKDCIIRWFERTHFCPFCRFKLPC